MCAKKQAMSVDTAISLSTVPPPMHTKTHNVISATPASQGFVALCDAGGVVRRVMGDALN